MREPLATLRAIYAFTGLPPFEHDVDAVTLDVGEFDARLGTPGLHQLRPRVSLVERRTILPPDLWQRYEGTSIWRHPDFNTHGVAVAELKQD